MEDVSNSEGLALWPGLNLKPRIELVSIAKGKDAAWYQAVRTQLGVIWWADLKQKSPQKGHHLVKFAPVWLRNCLRAGSLGTDSVPHSVTCAYGKVLPWKNPYRFGPWKG